MSWPVPSVGIILALPIRKRLGSEDVEDADRGSPRGRACIGVPADYVWAERDRNTFVC